MVFTYFSPSKHIFSFPKTLITALIVMISPFGYALDLTVTNNAAQGEGTLANTLIIANSATEDVTIHFSICPMTIYIDNTIYINNANGYSITLNGANNGIADQQTHITSLSSISNSQSSQTLFSIQSSNVTIKNLSIAFFNTAIDIKSTATAAHIENCEINDATYGIKVRASDCLVSESILFNCENGIWVDNEKFVLGSKNIILGTGTASSNGILLTDNASETTLGIKTGLRDNYSYVGGFQYGLKQGVPSSMLEIIIKGKSGADHYISNYGLPIHPASVASGYGCLDDPAIGYGNLVRSQDFSPLYFAEGDYIYFTDSDYDPQFFTPHLYSPDHQEITGNQIVELGPHRFLMSITTLPFASTNDVYTLELKRDNGEVKRMTFTKNN